MATLTGKTIASTYTSLLKLEGDSGSTQAGASGNAVQVKTGDDDATPLYFNTDRVGIGTNSPSHTLQVGDGAAADGILRASTAYISIDTNYQSSNVWGTASAPSLIFGGDSNTGFWHPGSDILAISTAGTERIRILANGNVGIGATSPQSLLQTEASSAGTEGGGIALYNSHTGDATRGSTLRFEIADSSATNVDAATIIGYKTGNASGGHLQFLTTAAASAGSWGPPAARMTIDDAGNVGIGTTSPGEKLEIEGLAGDEPKLAFDSYSDNNAHSGEIVFRKSHQDTVGNVQTTNGEDIGVISAWGNTGSAFALSSEIVMECDGNSGGTYAKGKIKFKTASASATPTDRMIVDGDGNVGIGTTAAFSTGTGLEIQRAGVATLRLENSSNSKTTELIQSATAFDIDLRNSQGLAVQFAGSDKVVVNTSGYVGIATDSPYAPFHVVGAGAGGVSDDSSNIPVAVFEGTSGSIGSSNPIVCLHNSSASPADDEYIGAIVFTAGDSGDSTPANPAEGDTYAVIATRIIDETETSSAGQISLRVSTNDSTAADNGLTVKGATTGGVSVGISTDTPIYPLEVQGNGTDDYVAMFDNSTVSSTAHGIRIKCGDTDHADNDTHYIQFIESDGGVVGTLDSDSGNLGFVDTSDVSLKKDIVDTSLKGLDIINGTRMVDYKWKKNDVEVKCGIVAQELEKIWKEGVDKIDDSLLGVKKSKFIYVLIKAVQELSAKVEALESK